MDGEIERRLTLLDKSNSSNKTEELNKISGTLEISFLHKFNDLKFFNSISK